MSSKSSRSSRKSWHIFDIYIYIYTTDSHRELPRGNKAITKRVRELEVSQEKKHRKKIKMKIK